MTFTDKDYEMGRACSTHGEKLNAYRVLMRKSERMRPLGRLTHRLEDNIKTDLREIVWAGMDWINMAETRDQWRALVNTVMNLRVQQNVGKFLRS
jgi:hypothetical protein